jgi:hypothetical protein
MLKEALEEAETKAATIERKVKMVDVLSPLSVPVMCWKQSETVDTDQLEEGYSTFIGRVLVETEITREGRQENY